MRKIDFSISTTEMTTGSAIFFARSSSDLRCLYSLSGIVALKDYVREKQFIRAVSERKGRTGNGFGSAASQRKAGRHKMRLVSKKFACFRTKRQLRMQSQSQQSHFVQ